MSVTQKLSTAVLAFFAVAAGLLLWAARLPEPLRAHEPSTPRDVPAHRVFSFWALGDTGRSYLWPLGSLFEGQRSVAAALGALDRASPADALVLLGDNFYPDGLEATALLRQVRSNLVRPYCRFVDLRGSRSAVVAPACPVAPEERHPVPIYAILGNHDWHHAESPSLQREVLPNFLPNWSVPQGAIDIVEVGEGLSLVRLDAEQIKLEGAWKAIERAVGEARGPWRIVLVHQPIARIVRVGNPFSSRVREALDRAGVPVQLVLSGHLHNLQLATIDLSHPSHQVVSGGGSERQPFRDLALRDPLYRVETTGFVRVDLLRDVDREGLLVTFYAAPRYPVLFWRDPVLLSEWWLDGEGSALELARATAE